MGSPLIPNLNVQSPQIDPMGQYGKLLSLRALMQEQQLRQGQQQLQGQQIQGAQQENQIRQFQIDDANKVRQAYQESGGNLDKFQKRVSELGVQPQTMIQLNESLLKMKTQYQALDEQTLKTAGERNKQLAPLLQNVINAQPEDRPAQWTLALNEALRNNLIKPEEAQGLQQYPGDERAQMYVNQHRTDADLIAQAEEARKKAKAPFEQSTAESESIIKGKEAKYGTPQLQESQYRSVLSRLAGKLPVSPDDMAAAVAYEASQAKTTNTSDSMGVLTSNTSKPAGLAQFQKGKPGAGGTGQGSTKQSVVDLIGNYQADPQLLGRMLYRHPEVLGLLKQKYPDWDQTTYIAKNKLIQGYTSGPQSKEINAVNTVSGHLSILNDAIDALNNGDVQLLNRVANTAKAQVGATPQTTFQTIVHRVGPEITTAYIPGAGGEAERLANAKDFSENLSPQQLKGNIATTVKLLRGKIGALENQYQQAVGRNDFQQRFITPQARAAFGRLAPEASAAPAGGPPPNLLKEGVHTTFKNGQTWTLQNGQPTQVK